MRFLPLLAADEAIDTGDRLSDLPTEDLRALLLDFAAEARRFFLIAEDAIHVVCKRQRGFPILSADLLLNRMAKCVAILLAKRDELGTITDELLLADEV